MQRRRTATRRNNGSACSIFGLLGDCRRCALFDARCWTFPEPAVRVNPVNVYRGPAGACFSLLPNVLTPPLHPRRAKQKAGRTRPFHSMRRNALRLRALLLAVFLRLRAVE